MSSNFEKALHLFHVDNLRPEQEQALKPILDGKDAIISLRTGGGKSLLYQLPALMDSPGEITLVFSPLIALQMDQVLSLRKKLMASEAVGNEVILLNSAMPAGERDDALCRIRTGRARLVYLAPEQLQNAEVRGALQSAAIRRVVVDEAQYELEHCAGQGSCIKTMKFSAWAVTCLGMYKKPYVKGNTYSGTYLAPVENHLILYFGQMNLDDIRPYHVQKYINTAAEKYAPETVKKDYTALALIFQTAVDNQLCSNNPMVKSIRLPKYETVTEKHAFTQEQYERVYAMAKSDPNGLAIMLLLETGISRSELLGLRWEDLDLDHALLQINQGLVFYHSEEQGKWISESDGLKNQHRQRSIPIVNPDLLESLKMLPHDLTVDKQTVKTQHVFHSPEGKPYQPNNWVNRVYRPFMDKVRARYPDIPKLSVRELRHTRATLWIAQGIDPYLVARLLGHSDLKMLTKIYDHTSPETLRKAIERTADKKGMNP